MGRARWEWEQRYGVLGSGPREIVIGGVLYDLPALMTVLGLAFEDITPIDVQMLGVEHYVVRYYDAEEHRLVAYEFDAAFHYLGERRVHIAEWIGDEVYFSTGWGIVRPDS